MRCKIHHSHANKWKQSFYSCLIAVAPPIQCGGKTVFDMQSTDQRVGQCLPAILHNTTFILTSNMAIYQNISTNSVWAFVHCIYNLPFNVGACMRCRRPLLLLYVFMYCGLFLAISFSRCLPVGSHSLHGRSSIIIFFTIFSIRKLNLFSFYK